MIFERLKIFPLISYKDRTESKVDNFHIINFLNKKNCSIIQSKIESKKVQNIDL
jgi:hypothetical protein